MIWYFYFVPQNQCDVLLEKEKKHFFWFVPKAANLWFPFSLVTENL